MIIIGYPGVGKSSICGSNNSTIDLESSMFHTGDEPHGWESIYCRVAADLSKQGYKVCISSHATVIDEIKQHLKGDRVYIVYPDPIIKQDWIDRLEKRYFESRTDVSTPHWIVEKNYRAWKHVEKYFDMDIFSLKHSGIENVREIIINDIDLYNLNQMINDCEELMG